MIPNPNTEASFAETIVDLLRQRASYRPHDRAFTFLIDGENEELNITYAELDRKARALGAWLIASGMAGKRVLLLYPSGLDFICAFMGCLYGGAIAVPAYPPRKIRSVERIEAIAADADASVALTTRDVLDRFDALRAAAPSLEKLLWKVDSELESDWADRWQRPDIDGNLEHDIIPTDASRSLQQVEQIQIDKKILSPSGIDCEAHLHKQLFEVRSGLSGRSRCRLVVGRLLFAEMHHFFCSFKTLALPSRDSSQRATYLNTRSVSRFTGASTSRRPSVVLASVCGMRATANAVWLTSTTVRLTPSIATEPFGAICKRRA